MNTKSPNLILVPLSKLVLRPCGRNVRKSGGASNDALAQSIARVGLLQNLTVMAGGRRLAALQWLAKQRRIAKTLEIPCLLVADEVARTASLTENVQREAMHPADQFEAFAALVAEGRPVEDIAADFGVTPLLVQRRLKLANVSPRLLADYRADAVTLEQCQPVQASLAWTGRPRIFPFAAIAANGKPPGNTSFFVPVGAYIAVQLSIYL